MGVLFLCDTAEYSCAYGSWNKVRMELLNASFRYLEKKLTIRDKADDGILLNPSGYGAIETFLMEKDKMKDVDIFIEIIDSCGHTMINHFIEFGIGGLWAIMNKQDDTGCYSPGNSLDILMLFKNVEPFIDDNIVRDRIKCMKKLFKHSVASRRFIRII
jgi:hypothetical protein